MPLFDCKICNSPEMPASSYASHILGRKHMKNYSNSMMNKEESTVVIKGVVPVKKYGMEILMEYVNRLSFKVEHATFYSKTGLLVFESEELAKEAMQRTIKIGGKRLILEASNKCVKQESENKSESVNEDVPALSPSLAKRISEIQEGSLDELCLNMVQEIGLSKADYNTRRNMGYTVERVLNDNFPGCQVYLFGSSANRLGFKGCDVDMVVDLGFDNWSDESLSHHQCTENAAKVTNSIARYLKRARFGYQIIPIPRARVPIVKFMYPNSQTQVDLSFKNGMPIFNSRLISLYCDAHPLVRPYMMLLRYWAKKQNVVGSGRPTTHLTSYCFSMMMLFWLMIRRKPIIPCVGKLQQDFINRNGSNSVRIIYGWNCSFSEDVSHYSKVKHHETVLEIMQEFFEFYSKMDASQWVISPLQGDLIKRTDFHHLKPSSRQIYLEAFYAYRLKLKLNTSLCVQDPFEMTNNICPGLKEARLKIFQMKCSIAAERCRSIVKKESPLKHLFTVYPVTKACINNLTSKDGNPDKSKKDFSQTAKKFADGELTTSQQSTMGSSDLEVIDVDILGSSDESVELSQEMDSIKRGGGMGLLMNENCSSSISTPVPGESVAKVLDNPNQCKNDDQDSTAGRVQRDPDIITLDNGLSSSKSVRFLKFIFEFEFKCHRPFEVMSNGKIVLVDSKELRSSDSNKSLFSLLHFILKQLFLCEVTDICSQIKENSDKSFAAFGDLQTCTEKSDEGGFQSGGLSSDHSLKRNSDESEALVGSSSSSKRHKPSGGVDSTDSALAPRIRLKKYDCKASAKFWMSRKQLSKTFLKVNSALLQKEFEISNFIACEILKKDPSYIWNQMFTVDLFRQSPLETESSRFTLEFEPLHSQHLSVKERKNVSHNFTCIVIWMKNFFKDVEKTLQSL